MNVVLLAAGGAIGAAARHHVGTFVLKREKHTFPIGIFTVNIIGAFLLGILCGLGISASAYILLGDGFCGAFTTFSTFMVESTELINGKAVKKAILYIFSTVFTGMVLFLLGLNLGKIILWI